MDDSASIALAPSRKADGMAVFLSALCLVHCLALPLLAAIAPVVAVLAENELVHKALVLAVLPITLWVCWQARDELSHRIFWVLAVGGLSLLAAAAFFPPVEAYEIGLTVVGSVLLGLAHLKRLLRHRGALHDLSSA